MSGDVGFVTTDQLRTLLGDETTSVIDVRPVEAYNGWTLHGEPRGGHIPGARSLPMKWFTYIDWVEIVNAKGITPQQQLVVYGYDEEESSRAAEQFQRMGFDRVSVYTGFLDQWAADPGLPLDAMPRYRHLVPADWLAKTLTGEQVQEPANPRHVLCHAHYRNPADYDLGHIPGAVALDTLLLESPETWNRRSPGELKAALQSLGITAGTTVTLYGRFSFPNNDDPFPGSSAGHLGAMRCAAILLYAGVKDVRVLNGGLQAWLDAGHEITTEPASPVPIEEFGAEIPGGEQYMVDIDEAKEIIADSGSNLVSVRSWGEYIGEVSGYNYIEKKGRIPGSVFGNCGSDAYHMENYRNLDHTTREYPEIEALWAEVGITAEKRNAFYCGTGWRGSEAFFNAWLMGWPRVAVFDGGWFEWSNDENNPCETGVPNEA